MAQLASGEYHAYKLPASGNLPKGSVKRLPMVDSVAGIACELPVINVAPGVHIAYLHLKEQGEVLTKAVAAELAKFIPADTDVIVTPDGSKALGLYVELQRLTGLPGVICPKQHTSYMVDGYISVAAVSITNPSKHNFHLSAATKKLIEGKNVVFVDDIVSQGGTKDAITALLLAAGAASITFIAVGTEGERRDDVRALHHFPVFLESA
jgi:adenine phosphoribosyltransferase